MLIDGAHRFPFPIIDWHYTERRFRPAESSRLTIYRMPSVRILHDFLAGEDDWELVREFQVTSFFRRARKTENVWDWADQNINKPHLERVMHKYAENGTKTGPGLHQKMAEQMLMPLSRLRQ